jgi:hypothetical protein
VRSRESKEMTARRYKKIPQIDSNDDEESKKQNSERLEQVSIKVHALFWVIASLALTYYLDILHLTLYDHRVNRLVVFETLSLSLYLSLSLSLVLLNLFL